MATPDHKPLKFRAIRASVTAAALLLAGTAAGVRAQGSGAIDSVLKQHYEAAQAQQSSGNLSEAARQYRLFVADALGELALQAANLKQYDKAAPLFDESLRLAPRSPGLMIRYAQAAYAASDLPRTRTLTEQVLREYPANIKAVAKAHLLLGRTLMAMNKEEAARDHFEAAVRLDPNFEDGYALAVACLDLGDGTHAAEIFAEMVKGLGDTAALHMEIGRAYLNSDFQQQAIPEFKKALAEDSNLPGVHYALAVAYLTVGGEGSTGLAESELQAELKLSPDDAATHAQLGNIALRRQDDAMAERELKRAIALDPTNPDSFYYLGQVYQESQRKNEAVDAFRRSIALTRDPAYNRYQVQKVHYLLGRLLMERGDTTAGQDEMKISSALLKRSLGHDRDRLAGSVSETSTASDTTKPPPDATVPERPTPAATAMQEFERRLAPALADSYNNLGVIAASDRHFPEALVSFQRAFVWKPDLEGLDANWGLAAFSSGQYAEAIAPLSRSLQHHPAETTTRSELAMSQFQTNDFVGTLKTLAPMKPLVDATPELAKIYTVSLAKVGISRSAGKDASTP